VRKRSPRPKSLVISISEILRGVYLERSVVLSLSKGRKAQDDIFKINRFPAILYSRFSIAAGVFQLDAGDFVERL